MSQNRIHRLLQLVTLLQSGGFHNASELMAEMQISRRTLFRDLKMLQVAGIPYCHDRERGYWIDRHFFLQPINLTLQETLGLLTMAKMFAPLRGRAMMGAVLSAVWKLVASVPDPIREQCDDMVQVLSVTQNAQSVAHNEQSLFQQLQYFIQTHRGIQVTYQRPGQSEPRTLKVDPYVLHFDARAWYLLGYCHEYDEVRLLKLARIRELKRINRHFSEPPANVVRQKLGQCWRLIAEGKIFSIELKFTPRVATNVSEVRWHSSQRVEFDSDGGCRVFFKVDGLKEIAWWICGYADQVQVIKPKALRQKVYQMHKAAARQYAAANGIV